MGEKAVGVPTMKGMGSAFKDFGIGALGGIGFLLLYQLFGAWGFLAAPLLAGSIIKGDRGSTISTMAGFLLFAAAAVGMTGGGGTSGGGNTI